MNIKVLAWCLVLLILVGCNGDSPTKTEMWNTIVNKEWSNFDVWAGNGMYSMRKRILLIVLT